MPVVVFVVYVGDRVGSVGGGGTLTATPPLGAPNGYVLGLVLPFDVVTVVVVVVADAVAVAVEVVALDAEKTPPTPSASETSATAATTPSAVSTRDAFNMFFNFSQSVFTDPPRIAVDARHGITASFKLALRAPWNLDYLSALSAAQRQGRATADTTLDMDRDWTDRLQPADPFLTMEICGHYGLPPNCTGTAQASRLRRIACNGRGGEKR